MTSSKIEILLVAAAIAIPSLALAADNVTVYGRAGTAVGADRIQQLSTLKSTPVQGEVANWYGRAGGPVGEQRVATVSPPKVYAAGDHKLPVVYGRAGVPLPFGN